jgi:hypothetical protein
MQYLASASDGERALSIAYSHWRGQHHVGATIKPRLFPVDYYDLARAEALLHQE